MKGFLEASQTGLIAGIANYWIKEVAAREEWKVGYTIAMAGKGGTGKTTLAGLMIRYLVRNGKRPVLAVDADSNSNLNEVLGIKVEATLGDAREEMKMGGPPNMTKDIFMEMKVNQALVEGQGYDLIAMGRPEGEGCYCAANNLLSECVQRLSKNYPYLVIDNEAGMEHISRLTTREVDLLIIVSDATRRGLLAAQKIDELTQELKLTVRKKALVINQAKEDSADILRDQVEKQNILLAGFIPEDALIYDYDMKGLPTITLPEDAPSVKAAFYIFDLLLDA
jgi:CO dehydrogenase maturation factor